MINSIVSLNKNVEVKMCDNDNYKYNWISTINSAEVKYNDKSIGYIAELDINIKDNIDKKSNIVVIELSLDELNNITEKKRIFKEFWKEVERSHDPKGYVAMIGMEEYPMLGIENAEEQYHAQIGMLAKYPEIPLWDYGAGIKAFMDQFIGCPIDEKSQEIIDRIINSEGGKAVIHYIAVYRKKTGDDVKEEKIETQYREFLKELIYCWADGRCTFG